MQELRYARDQAEDGCGNIPKEAGSLGPTIHITVIMLYGVMDAVNSLSSFIGSTYTAKQRWLA